MELKLRPSSAVARLVSGINCTFMELKFTSNLVGVEKQPLY